MPTGGGPLEIEAVQNTLEMSVKRLHLTSLSPLLPTDTTKKVYFFLPFKVYTCLKHTQKLEAFVPGTITLQKCSRYKLVDHQNTHRRFSPTFLFSGERR